MSNLESKNILRIKSYLYTHAVGWKLKLPPKKPGNVYKEIPISVRSLTACIKAINENSKTVTAIAVNSHATDPRVL